MRLRDGGVNLRPSSRSWEPMIGHESADQQHAQVEQRQFRCARDGKRNAIAKLTQHPGPGLPALRTAQKRKAPRRIGKKKMGRLATPEMQKNSSQSDLLAHSQHHLEETCRPPVKQSSRAAWARTAHSYFTFAGCIDWLFGQGSLSDIVSGLPAKRKDVDR
jgi:hypothetical protein